MGYYSKYTMSIQSSEEDKENLEKELRHRYDASMGMCDASIVYFNEKNDLTKWYEYQDDMTEISKLFPDILFTLKREGEENGHIEKSFYKNGKKQICTARIVFDDYDETKLE